MDTPPGEKRRRGRAMGSAQPPGRMSKRQELVLFVLLLIVLLGLIAFGMRA